VQAGLERGRENPLVCLGRREDRERVQPLAAQQRFELEVPARVDAEVGGPGARHRVAALRAGDHEAGNLGAGGEQVARHEGAQALPAPAGPHDSDPGPRALLRHRGGARPRREWRAASAGGSSSTKQPSCGR
jgi:hypothetical protein